MSLVTFYCDSCNFCNLSRCVLYQKVYFIVNFTISNVPEDGLKCHPKRNKQFFKKIWICQKTCVLFRQFKITWND